VSGPVAVLDACVLIPIRLATTLLWLAETGLFQPLWSEPILDEVQRNLPKVGVTPEQASRRVGLMREAFGAEALIDSFDDLIEQMRCDPKDRHVLAAAVRGGADTLVTCNLKDFPDEAGVPYGIGIWHPDSFLVQLLGEHTDTVVATLERETAAFRNPPETVPQFLTTLTTTVPMFANLAADAFHARPGQPPRCLPWLGSRRSKPSLRLVNLATRPIPLRSPSRGGRGSAATSTWPVISPTTPQPGATTSGRSATSPADLWPLRSSMLSTLLTRSRSCDSFPKSRLRPRCSRRT